MAEGRARTRVGSATTVVMYAGYGRTEQRRRFAPRFTAGTKYPWLGVIIDFITSPVDGRTRPFTRRARDRVNRKTERRFASTRRISFPGFIDSACSARDYAPRDGRRDPRLRLACNIRPDTMQSTRQNRPLGASPVSFSATLRETVPAVNNVSYLNCRGA